MYDVVIIGAGASGLMCALAAKISNPNLNILILEKNSKIGKKILITGNGKCNLGNNNILIDKYNNSTDLNRFKKELESNDYLSYISDLGIIIKEDNDRLYPYSMQALTVCKSFERKLTSLGVEIKCDYEVNKVVKTGDVFVINSDMKTRNLVIATGGKTYSKTGSTGFGYQILKQFGHTITDLYPSLTNLKTNYKGIKNIAGVRFDGTVSLLVDGKLMEKQDGQIQFTNDSVSGICVFNLSRNVSKYLSDGKKVSISADLMSEYDAENIKKDLEKLKNYTVVDALSCMINDKLAYIISKDAKVLDKKISELNNEELDNITYIIKNMIFNIIGTGDFESSQVTNGGALLSEFNNDLMSNIVNNLFVTGEVLNVDGICGGYNLAWAFTSGMVVGKSIK